MGAPPPNGSLGPTDSPQRPGGGAAAGPGERGCENGALMDSFGIFLQGLLGVVAFSTLMREWRRGRAGPGRAGPPGCPRAGGASAAPVPGGGGSSAARCRGHSRRDSGVTVPLCCPGRC